MEWILHGEGMMPKPCCGNCRFSAQRGPLAWECHKNAPEFVVTSNYGVFPIMSEDEWCGEHKPKEIGKRGEDG